VELHLLGCRLGVAVVEDRYLPELNPNVAMEWGWMRAMGKPVLFLVEKSFTKFRADIGGLITAQFSWDDPEGTVEDAISPWLSKLK
jgi:nucleoside 2-deoxyribosyltransferase